MPTEEKDSITFINDISKLVRDPEYKWTDEGSFSPEKIKKFSNQFKEVVKHVDKPGVKGAMAKITGLGSQTIKVFSDISKNADKIAKIYQKQEDLNDSKKCKEIQSLAKKIVKSFDSILKKFDKNELKNSRLRKLKGVENFKLLKEEFEIIKNLENKNEFAEKINSISQDKNLIWENQEGITFAKSNKLCGKIQEAFKEGFQNKKDLGGKKNQALIKEINKEIIEFKNAFNNANRLTEKESVEIIKGLANSIRENLNSLSENYKEISMNKLSESFGKLKDVFEKVRELEVRPTGDIG